MTSPCFGFRQNIPLLVKERDNRVRSTFPLLFEGEGCLRSRQGEVSLLVEHTASLSCPPILTSPCFGFRQNVPLLTKGEGPEGEVCHPHFVLPNAVQPSHPHWIPRYARNDTSHRGMTSPCFGFRQNVPLLVEGEGPEGEVCYPPPCHAERSEASMHWMIPHCVRNNNKKPVAPSVFCDIEGSAVKPAIFKRAQKQVQMFSHNIKPNNGHIARVLVCCDDFLGKHRA